MFVFITNITICYASNTNDGIGQSTELNGTIIKPKGGVQPKSPMKRSITIYYDNEYIYLGEQFTQSTLSIYDQEENLVFETIIQSGTNIVSLPLFLIGEYEISINDGIYIYRGKINYNK